MDYVSIAKCDDYDYKKVQDSVQMCLDSLGGIKEKIKPKDKVLLKVNLLKRNLPDDAVTTHPAVVEAVVTYLHSIGCKVIIGDSPAGPFSKKLLEGVYKACGMLEVAQKTGCELNYDTSVIEVVNDKAKMLKNMQIIKAINDVDHVVSVAKLKTHGMMTFTGAVKNLFGVIPGLIKAEYHFKMNDEANFAQHLVDICEYVQPVFSIIDGIEGMEGNGPSSGDKRKVGLLMASTNPYALDTAACEVIGIKPFIVPTIKIAADRTIFSGDLKDIKILGYDYSALNIEPFKLPDSKNVNFVGGKVPKFLEKYFVDTLRSKPEFDLKACISCGDCKRSCPPNIIDMSTGKPVPDLSKCIACFCCHEVCPKKAIRIKKHWLQKLLFR